MFENIKRYKSTGQIVYDCFYLLESDTLYCEDNADSEACKTAISDKITTVTEKTVAVIYDSKSGKTAYLEKE